MTSEYTITIRRSGHLNLPKKKGTRPPADRHALVGAPAGFRLRHPRATRHPGVVIPGNACYYRPGRERVIGRASRRDRDMPLEKLQCTRCLRHGGDVDRGHLFLCSDCAQLYRRDAFRDAAPLFSTATGAGRCEYCDNERPISYFQWLLCGYCVRVVQSYRMGRISANFALEQLRAAAGVAGGLVFEETDPVVIQATGRRGRRRELATTLDLRARKLADNSPAFWVEIKTGPGSIDEISEFQLDCSDCDDIMNAVRTSGIPALLVHCQIAKFPQPPTMRLLGQAVWWTDLRAFANAFNAVRARRGNERKFAAYFDTKCFRPVATFGTFLAEGGHTAIAEALARDGCPTLYHR